MKISYWHVPVLGEKCGNELGTEFFPLDCIFKKTVLVSCFIFFITFLVIIFYNNDHIKSIIIVFLFGSFFLPLLLSSYSLSKW